ncbi:MAG: virulence RhuM family protein [Kiritimatiellae bacterium]|nr:virulence RhuM family protein [Kiritimatiellia bacterium]
MRMQDWVAKLDALLTLSGRQLLTGNGSISHEEACRKAIAEFREYRRREMIQYKSDFDRAVRELTEGGEHPDGENDEIEEDQAGNVADDGCGGACQAAGAGEGRADEGADG